MKALGRMTAHEGLHSLDKLLARALLEDTAGIRRQRNDPGEVVARESTVGKSLFQWTRVTPLLKRIGHGCGLGVVVQVESQRILARKNLGPQLVSPLDKIIERRVEPGVALDELAHFAHLMGRQGADLGWQTAQILRKQSGVAQVGRPIR